MIRVVVQIPHARRPVLGRLGTLLQRLEIEPWACKRGKTKGYGYGHIITLHAYRMYILTCSTTLRAYLVNAKFKLTTQLLAVQHPLLPKPPKPHTIRKPNPNPASGAPRPTWKMTGGCRPRFALRRRAGAQQRR